MNCTTGEISSDPIKFEEWREDGDRILHLPDAPAESDLLSALGAEVRNAERERKERIVAKGREFVQSVNERLSRRG